MALADGLKVERGSLFKGGKRVGQAGSEQVSAIWSSMDVNFLY